uniref:G-protein coupled receptors family 1 profile domain-containing protein n=1 Tax=Neolamprologus brichardi TaxID=32507 RepID=A0A3Q4GS83_NEOBR
WPREESGWIFLQQLHHTESLLQMENFNDIYVIMLINIYACLPFTMADPITYYANLLFSNLVQCSIMFPLFLPLPSVFQYADQIFHCTVIASISFKMCIATERYSLIGCPLLACFRQIKRSLLVSALVWAFCIITVVPATVFEQFIIPPIFALLPAPLFIVCLAGTIKALRAATSVPTEEKRRTVGTLVLLLFNYCLMMVQIWIVWCFLSRACGPSPFHCCSIETVVFSLFPLSPFLDLILFVFM